MKITNLRYWLYYGSVVGVSAALLGGCGGDNKTPGAAATVSAASTPAADTPAPGTSVASTPVAGTPVESTPVTGTPAPGAPVIAGIPAAATPIADGSPPPAAPALPPPVIKPVAKADQPYDDPNTYSSSYGGSLPADADLDKAAVTHHTMMLKGEQVDYTATVGHLSALAPNPDGTKPVDKQVSVFYVAYTRDDKPAGTRPVTFFWNGGPGSSTVWLHLGSWGPKRLQIDEAALTTAQLMTPPESFPLVDNDMSMLDNSDLVFVDATGTGYSQAIAPHTNGEFWGVDADTRIFRDFITRYIAVNHRETSPKYLYGESYGGIRTPIVADLLLQAGSPGKGGPALTGMILNSPILSYKTNCYMYNSESCAGFIPSYAAVAYSKKVATDPLAATATLAGYMDHLRLFVARQWAPELPAYRLIANTIGTDLTFFTLPEQALFAAMGGKTGLTAESWAAVWNMPSPIFRSAILTRLGLGYISSHMDAYNGLVTIPEDAEYDADKYNNPAFANQIKDFLPSFLKYTNKSAYTLQAESPALMWKWSHGLDASNRPTSLPDLTDALTLNPALKVIVLHGYHDLVTPFHQTELDLSGANLADRVPVQTLVGGHMTYLTQESRQPMKQAIDNLFKPAPTATQ